MRKFILTGEKFKGQAELWYGFDGLICYLNFTACTMDYIQLKWMLGNISADIEQFRGLLPVGVKAKEEPFDVTLDEFKRIYPYSRNYHLLDDLWPTLTLKEKVAIYFGAIAYRKYCERNEKWYKPKIAHGWIKSKEYLNDWKNL